MDHRQHLTELAIAIGNNDPIPECPDCEKMAERLTIAEGEEDDQDR